VSDDVGQIVQSQSRYTWSAVPGYFGSDVWNFIIPGKTDYYRPVFLLWMMLNSKLFGLNTELLHAAALGLHLAATLLLYFLALRLTGNALASGAAALLFGIHPAHIEVAAWLSGVTESLFAVLALGAILCQLRGRRAGALLLFAFAIFTKETAVVLPLLLAACDWLLPEDSAATRSQRLRKAVSTLAWCLGIGLIYMAARLHALGAFAPITRGWTPQRIASTIPSLLVFYLRQLLAPFEYSMFYPIYAVTHFSLRRTAEPLMLLAMAALALLLIGRRSKSLAFAALLFVVPIAPTLNLSAFLFDNFAHDRYVYLPSAGLCLLMAILAAGWMQSSHVLHKDVLHPAVLGGVFVAAAVWLAYVNLQNSGVWTDDLSLFTHAVEVAPDNIMAREYLANALLRQQRYTDALPLFQEALLRGQPTDEATNQLLYVPIAICYIGLGQSDQAEGFLYRAISLDPAAHVPHFYLALIEESRGRWSEAEAHAREALRLRPAATPELSAYHGELGRILENEGNPQAALAEYRAQVREDPASAEARKHLEEIEQRAPVP
jgi:tetratricopeptide (TPR) repeat protein